MFKINQYCQCSCIYCLKPFTVFNNLYDFISPDFYLCKQCKNNLIYRPIKIYMNDIVVSCLYQYNDFFSSIFNRYKRYGDLILAKWLKKQHSIPFYYQQIQVPSSIKAKEERGFNHLKLIYPKSIEVFLKNDFYVQKNSRLFKRKQICFELKSNINLSDRVCLVDDVITTGSSILEAKRLIPQIKKSYVICYHPLLLKQYRYRKI